MAGPGGAGDPHLEQAMLAQLPPVMLPEPLAVHYAPVAMQHAAFTRPGGHQPQRLHSRSGDSQRGQPQGHWPAGRG